MISARPSRVPRTLAIRAALAIAGSAALALSAQIAVPLLPVPITLQTLAIPLLVLAIGRDLAVFATLAYLVEGAAGLPVFALHSAGAAVLAGPTAGYLWCYPLAAYLTGTLCDAPFARSYAGRWLAIFAGTSVVFAGGVWWLMVGAGLTLSQAIAAGVAPFVIGDVLKCSLAAASSSRANELFAKLGI